MSVRVLNRIEEAVIALLLVATTLLVFVDVVLRFGFGTGWLWSQELTLHLSAWFVLFGASYGVKVGAHIGVDALVRVLPRRARRAASAVAVAAALVYCGLFLAGSWIYLGKMFRIGIEMEDLPVPLWVAHGILLVGFALLALRLLQLLWRVLRGEAEGFRFADEAEESLHLARGEAEEARR
ncbi:TRAP transporter small permease [Inmirania thermothiophila]|uniref:TRAP transporter small permease protein n=1 Tax=Inmirania thermothiophila TaxID=1750597 RepID=A0A3N1Y6T1_9GAMM|nr:TRAP transporter small permease subunit [Inmirania thermothiophila]ROR34539.1 C4-dicarboxylate transporter DctQ subunit [Inmirania thermothiophila]